jgi:hypothetical protein
MRQGRSPLAEDLLYFLEPISEKTLQLAFYEDGIDQTSQKAKRQLVMHDIRHFNASPDLLKMMLVMPETIGSPALLVHKISAFHNMGDLRHPVYPHEGQRAKAIF